jgi:hypothetical protein
MFFKYLLQPNGQAKTLFSQEQQIYTFVERNKTQGVDWVKIKSPGDNYSCIVEFNAEVKVVFENKKL